MGTDEKQPEKVFTSYQVFVIAILSLLQFTVILDFMVLSPLGAILMEKLNVTTSQFGLVVSAYAFSAGGAGLLTAGFADKFDRKKTTHVLLYWFYYWNHLMCHCTQLSIITRGKNSNRHIWRGNRFG